MWSGLAANSSPPATHSFGLASTREGRPPEGARLARLVEVLRGTPGLDAVVGEVGGATWQNYKHGVMGLEFAAGLRGRGCGSRYISPTNDPSPDLSLTLVDRPVTVELKALHEPDDEEVWHALERRLSVALGRVGLSAGIFDVDLEWSAIDNPDAVFEGLLRIAAKQSSDYVPLPDGTGKARLSSDNVARRAHPGRAREDIDRILSKLRGLGQSGRHGGAADAASRAHARSLSSRRDSRPIRGIRRGGQRGREAVAADSGSQRHPSVRGLLRAANRSDSPAASTLRGDVRHVVGRHATDCTLRVEPEGGGASAPG
jgi:hypothetical protein